MTREEAIKILEHRRRLICQTCHFFHTPFVCERCNEGNCKGEKEALKMAIGALKADPKHGKWLDRESAPWGQVYETCSVCLERQTLDYGLDHFCPICGAKMDERREDG